LGIDLFAHSRVENFLGSRGSWHQKNKEATTAWNDRVRLAILQFQSAGSESFNNTTVASDRESQNRKPDTSFRFLGLVDVLIIRALALRYALGDQAYIFLLVEVDMKRLRLILISVIWIPFINEEAQPRSTLPSGRGIKPRSLATSAIVLAVLWLNPGFGAAQRKVLPLV